MRYEKLQGTHSENLCLTLVFAELGNVRVKILMLVLLTCFSQTFRKHLRSHRYLNSRSQARTADRSGDSTQRDGRLQILLEVLLPPFVTCLMEPSCGTLPSGRWARRSPANYLRFKFQPALLEQWLPKLWFTNPVCWFLGYLTTTGIQIIDWDAKMSVWVGEDVKERDVGMFQGNPRAVPWRKWGKHEKPQSGLLGTWTRFELGTFQVQVYSATVTFIYSIWGTFAVKMRKLV